MINSTAVSESKKYDGYYKWEHYQTFQILSALTLWPGDQRPAPAVIYTMLPSNKIIP